MEFKSGKLKIPPLFINDSTGPLLRNLIAYEQSDRYPAPCFSCLVIILDSLVDTIEDIDILRDAGIIKQVKGGNEEVVNLLNSLSKHLEFDIDDYCITEKIVAVNHFYRSKWFRVLFILVHSKIGYLGQSPTNSIMGCNNYKSRCPSDPMINNPGPQQQIQEAPECHN
nr:putative upf0481 protein [Quercus suber]